MDKGMWDLSAIILGVVVGVLLIGIAWKAVGLFNEPADIKTCRLTTIAAAQVRGTPSAVSITRTCQTHIDEDLEKIVDREEALPQLSRKLWECWYMNAEGKYHAFAGKDTSRDAQCFVCNQFRLHEEVTIPEQTLLEFTQRDAFVSGDKRDSRTVYQFIKDGLLQWRGGERVLLQSLVLPKEENTIQRILSTITADLDPNMPMWQKPKAYWNIWTEEATIQLLDQLESGKDYAVVYYQVSPQYWRQSWEARAVTAVLSSETIAEVTKVPPANVFIMPLDAIAGSSCAIMQG